LPSKLRNIVSGGQTGADRAAWDSAIDAGIATGGFVPVGRQAEDGPIPAKYPGLTETISSDPMERTRLNVIDSDATLLFSHGPPAGGSRLTAEFAAEHSKPLLYIDLAAVPSEDGVKRVIEWIGANKIGVLNVAGPRASEDPLIYDAVREFLGKLFSSL
jgi:predicted Rossmann fold nucleotide-binding protein DprA/Smf involved in DNA uptake